VKQPIAIVSVINDLVTDQRVDRACKALIKCGYGVLLVGRVLPNSLPVNKRTYKTKRMKLLFTQGPLFYIEFQFRLFFLLLFRKKQLLYANDLDTLLPNFLISKISSSKLIYDSHELFCEVPELINNPKKQKAWKTLERWIFPYLKNIITVNKSIAEIYEKEYGKPLHIVRNIPTYHPVKETLTRKDLNLDEHKKIVILQGAGINIQRGAEEAVQAMQYVQNTILLIVGSGDVIEQLKSMRQELKIEDRVIITGKVPYERLAQYTRLADLGLSLDKDTNLNYRYSLPNKLFDYIHAGLPLIVSPLFEISQIVKQYQIGIIINNHDPKHIAQCISTALEDKEQYSTWKKNLLVAQKELNWSSEEKELLHCIKQA